MTYAESKAGSNGVYFGIEWNENNSSATQFTIAPVVYRWDAQSTNNYGSSFKHTLSPDPSGAGSWSGISYPSGSGYRQLDYFNTRTYTKTHSVQTITWTAITDASFGTYYNGWVSIGSLSRSFTMTIPAKTSYTVSFNANGGSGAPSSQKKWYGESLTLSTTKPTRTGYTFNGWNTKSDGTGTNYAAGASYTGNAALTLYAKWTINTWTVSYNGNSNTGGSTASQTKTYGTALTLRANGFTRMDFAFKRWNTKSDDTGTAYNASASYTGNAALTLYAIWNRTVTFNANGGSGAPSAQTAVATSAITLSSTKPTRTSYVFKRWNTNTSDSGTAYSPGGSYAKNLGSTTLYAIWNPVVSYDANGGLGAPSSQTKTYGTALTLSTAVPTRTGFSFKQWNTNSSGTGTAYNSGASYTSNAAATLYAIWNATVSYDANGGSGALASQTAAYGSTITLSSTVPTRAGHTFLGWNTASDGSGTDYSGGDSYPASNGGMTLYAKWRVDIVVSGLTCQLTDSNGTPDALGRYVTVSASYDTTSSGNDCTYFGATLTVAGSSSELHAETTGATGSESFTFGPYAYGDLTPAGNTSVGTLTASNADGSIEHALETAATGYAAPKVASLVAFRETDRQEADDGTDLGIEVGWSVFQTASQSRPASVTLELTDLSTGTVVAERTWTGTVDNPATLHVYPDSGLYPDDVLVDGELVNVERNYAARVTVYDAWKSAVRTDMVTVAYFTMDFLAGGHGVAFGKPSTRDLLDVGMQAQFDVPVLVADRLSMPAYVFATLPAQADIPAGPALVLTEDDFGLYYFDGDSTTS